MNSKALTRAAALTIALIAVATIGSELAVPSNIIAFPSPAISDLLKGF